MKSFAITALLGGIANASFFKREESGLMTDADYKFMAHVVEFGQSYGTRAEYEFRSAVFKKNLADIEAINADPKMTHTVGINEFSTWTTDERKVLTGYKMIKDDMDLQENVQILDTSNLADGVNWVSKGSVTAVKNQGQCGSCWAFSTTGAMEGAHHIKSGDLLTLSEQQLVDCSRSNAGCNGGQMNRAFLYTKTHPLMLEDDYPYDGKSHGIFGCKSDKSKGKVSSQSYTDVMKDDAEQFKAALNMQPLSVAIEADKMVFQQYQSGVITGDECGDQLNHGVLAVGYGTLNGEEYILVKNSWGDSWGDHGYVRIGINNVCGILHQPCYPVTD